MKKMARSLMSWKRSFALFLLSAFTIVSAFAQDRTVSGTVLDDKGEPAIGATVMVKGTGIGTMTDFDGNYSLNVPAGSNELEVSYVGMETQVVAIAGNKVDVKLGESAQALEEVVVTGYGETKKRDVVTSVASVSADQIKNMPVTNAAEALQGKLTGVSVTTTEGSPDAEVKIRVRGGSSLTQSSEPLYIVDGFPVSSINDISPSDIQSMDVLKDAAATAIYGAQGANGVIIITTKDANVSEKDGESKSVFHVDYSGYVGWKEMSNPYKMLNNREFTMLQYEYAYLTKHADLKSAFDKYFDNAWVDGGSYTPTPIATLLDSVQANVPFTDWQDETFGKKALTSNHSISLSGGNKNANFTMSYNRIDDEGIMQESDYTRNNLSLKAKFKPLKGLTIGASVRYTNTTVLGSGANTADDAGSKTESRVRNAIAYVPFEPLFKDPASIDDEESFGSMYDPITTISDNYKFKRDNKFNMQAYAAYKFLKHFTLRTEVGYEYRNTSTDRFYGPTAYYSRAGDGYSAVGATGYSSAMKTDLISSRLRNTNTFEYKQRYNGGHNFSILLGEETVVDKGTEFKFTGFGYEGHYSGAEVFQNLGLAKDMTKTQYIDPTDNMLSFFARANYDYKGRYFVTATFRADASTRFNKENQWGYFPAAAIAWRLSDEPFMRSAARAAKLSNLKFRFSYGVAGNNNVDLGYLRLDYLINTSANIPLSAFSSQNYLTAGGADKIAANPNLKWETTTTRDFGIDYGFFNDRLSGALDLYWNSTKDLILKYKLSNGYNFQYRNIGKTKNLGVEFSVKGVILDKQSKDLNYSLTLDANISANKNTVEDLGGLTEYYVSTGYMGTGYDNGDAEFKLEEGLSVGRVWGYVADGWYTAKDFDTYNPSTMIWTKDGKKIETVVASTSFGARPGTMKLKDLNNDGKITAEDRTEIGNTMPDFTGGFSLGAHVGGDAWGRVDVAANFTYSYGNDVVNMTAMDMTAINEKTKMRNSLESVAFGKRYSLFDESGNYLPDQGVVGGSGLVEGEAYNQMAQMLDDVNAGATVASPIQDIAALTSNAVEDGSYLRLQSLTVGYSLPDKWLRKAYITKARIFFTASNLFTVTNYSGSDPEVDTGSKRNPLAIGIDWSAYPKSRAFNFGINLSF